MPDEPAEVQRERALLQHHHDLIKGHIGPHLAEHFDGYVLMGYTTTEQGVRRLVIWNHGDNPLMADALRTPLSVAARWGTGQL